MEYTVKGLQHYQFNSVLLTLASGVAEHGRLEGFVQNESGDFISLSKRPLIPLHELVDIEEVGHISEFHTKDLAVNGKIMSMPFTGDMLAPDFPKEYLYHDEFDCQVAYHVELDEQGRRIPRNIRLLSAEHYLPKAALNHSRNWIYTVLEDGQERQVVGRYEVHNIADFIKLCTPRGVHSLHGKSQIIDITPAPILGDYIRARDFNGNSVEGSVQGVDEMLDTANLLCPDGEYRQVCYSRLEQLLYRGTVLRWAMNSFYVRAGNLECRIKKRDQAALQEQVSNLMGQVVFCRIGVSKGGMEAKDVQIECSQSAAPQSLFRGCGIIIIPPTLTRSVGYIGRDYISPSYRQLLNLDKSALPQGHVFYMQDQLSLQPVDTLQDVYLVDYVCAAPPTQGQAQPVLSATPRESFPYENYARIWLDEEDNIHTLAASAVYLYAFVGKEVLIDTKSDEHYRGILLSADQHQATVRLFNQELVTMELEEIEKASYAGVITRMKSDGTGWVSDFWFHVKMSAPEERVQLEVGQQVFFSVVQSRKGANWCAADLRTIMANRRDGYVWDMSGMGTDFGSGTILPPAESRHRELGERWSGAIPFVANDISDRGGFSLDEEESSASYYRVNYFYSKQGTALDVRFLEKIPRPSLLPSAAAAADPIPPSDPAELSGVSPAAEPSLRENEPAQAEAAALIQEVLPIPACRKDFGGAEVRYGFMPLPKKYPFISELYCHRKFLPARRLRSLYLPNQGAQFLQDYPTISAVDFCLVAYAWNPATEEIDPNYPVELLGSYPKAVYLKGEIQNGQIVLSKQNDKPAATSPAAKSTVQAAQADGEEIFSPANGETVAIMDLSDGSWRVETWDRSAAPSPSEQRRLYRFGEITGFSSDQESCRLNGAIAFPSDCLERKAYNVLINQAQSPRLSVLYRCEGRTVQSVSTIPRELLNQLPWQEGVVSQQEPKPPHLVLQTGERHAITVLSDGLVSRNFRDPDFRWNGVKVYFRRIVYPFCGPDKKWTLRGAAAELRLAQELLTISFNLVTGRYVGYRSTSVFFPLDGDLPFMERQANDPQNKPIPVNFHPSGNFSTLIGTPQGAKQVPLELDSPMRSGNINWDYDQEPLVQLGLQVDLRQLLPNKVALGSDGLPLTEKDACEAIRLLEKENSTAQERFAAAKIRKAFSETDFQQAGLKQRSYSRAILFACHLRCKELQNDPNCSREELAGYRLLLLRGTDINDTQRSKYLLDLLHQELENGTGGRHPKNISDLRSSIRGRAVQNLLPRLIALEANSTQKMIQSLLKSDADSELSQALLKLAEELDGTGITIRESYEALKRLQKRYWEDRARFREHLWSNIDRPDQLKNILDAMESGFLRLVSEAEAERFIQLKQACINLLPDPLGKGAFSRREEQLSHAYRNLKQLKQEVLGHPGHDSLPLLAWNGTGISTDLLDGLQAMAAARLDALYADEATRPAVSCVPNETVLTPSQTSLWLLLSNGKENEQRSPASEVTLQLQSFTGGVNLPQEIKLPTPLTCGEPQPVEVKGLEIALDQEDRTVLEQATVQVGVTLSFKYQAGFRDGKTITKEYKDEDERVLAFTLGNASLTQKKNLKAMNPYEKSAAGHALPYDDPMFFGRDSERAKIRQAILTFDEDDRPIDFQKGSTVMIWGQRKCGKTSLVARLKKELETQMGDKAIILDFSEIFGATNSNSARDVFPLALHSAVLSRLFNELKDNHPELLKKLGYSMSDPVPQPTLSADQRLIYDPFDDVIRNFKRVDQGEHTIVLLMDEFTVLAADVRARLKDDPQAGTVLAFIKTFSLDYGFVQVIIGHDTMRQILADLGVINHTIEFATAVEVGVLDEKSAREMIVEPMCRTFGYNPYGTQLGEQAIDELLRLSGRHPTFLARLCDQLFRYYVNEELCPADTTQLVLQDVEYMLEDYLVELEASSFDALLVEDGDNSDDYLQLDTFKFLQAVAYLAKDSPTGGAKSIDLEKALKEFPQTQFDHQKFLSLRRLLENRRVIRVGEGEQVRIVTRLLEKFINHRHSLLYL